MRDPKPLSALVSSALKAVTNNQQRCPFCGTPHKLIGSPARVDLNTTWTAQIQPDFTIAAPPLTKIIQLHEAHVLLVGQRLPLEVDVDIHATDNLIFTNNPVLDAGTTLAITATINMPRVVIASPLDKCCVARATQLGRRLLETKGKTEESQQCRSQGAYLLAWAKKNEQLFEEAQAQPVPEFEPRHPTQEPTQAYL